VFFAGILLVAGFLSCLTAMRYAIQGSEVTVPKLTGRTTTEAAQLLGASGLELKVDSHRYHDSVPKDRVVSQVPGVDARLKRHSNVRVVVSLGAKRIPVPDLKGETLRAAQILLLRRGLALGMTSSTNSDAEESGRIIAQDPEPESQFAQSPRISLLVSSGRRRREYLMPDLTGKSSHEVVAQFADLGFNLGSVRYQSIPGVEKDTILGQFPLAGSKVLEGSAIDIEVCQ
jgi:beta-lactam-binding protein with PASTA domain